MRRKFWEWIVRHFPSLLVFYYTMCGRTDSNEMKRVLIDIENKKTRKKLRFEKHSQNLHETMPKPITEPETIVNNLQKPHDTSSNSNDKPMPVIKKKPSQVKPPVKPLPLLKDDGLALRKEVDEGIARIKNADLLIGKDNVLIFGNIGQSLYAILKKIYEISNKFHFVWLINFRELKSPSFKMTSFYIPAGFICIPGYGWENKFCFSLTKDEEHRVDNEEHLILAYNTIMTNLPHMDEKYIKLVVLEIERYYSAVLNFIKPKLVMIFNEFSYINRITLDLSKKRGIPVMFAEHGNLPGTLNFDTFGELGESLPARYPGWSFWFAVNEDDLKCSKDIIKYLKDSKINRKKQPLADISNIHMNLNNHHPTVFYAGLFDMGSGICPYNMKAKKYHSPIFSSSHEAMLFLAKLAEKNNWNLIYKPHPIMVQWNIENENSIPNNVIYVPLGDINEIVDIADVTVTILSTTAYVALIREKPVVMMGYIHLCGQKCTYEAFELDKVESTISEAIKNGYTNEQKEAFAEHIAKMCKYYLFDDLRECEMHYGRPAEDALKYLESVIDGTAEF